MKNARYEVWKNGAAEWQWHLKAKNGELVAVGEGYKKKSGALRGIEAHRRCAATATVKVYE